MNYLCSPFGCASVLIFKASFILYGRRPSGTSAPSINTNSTVMAPCTSSVSYGRGWSARICDDVGPTANSSMPTRPRPRNFDGASIPVGLRSYTSKRISAECGDSSLKKRECFSFHFGALNGGERCSGRDAYKRKCSSQYGFVPWRAPVWFFCCGSSISMIQYGSAACISPSPFTTFTNKRRPDDTPCNDEPVLFIWSKSYCVCFTIFEALHKYYMSKEFQNGQPQYYHLHWALDCRRVLVGRPHKWRNRWDRHINELQMTKCRWNGGGGEQQIKKIQHPNGTQNSARPIHFTYLTISCSCFSSESIVLMAPMLFIAIRIWN